MIQLSERIAALLSQPVLNTFICLQIGDMRITTYSHNITLYDSTNPYIKSKLIEAIERPQMTAVINRDLYSITLADSGRELASMFDAGLNGAQAVVHLCFVDYYTGEPEVDETFIIYKGIVESHSYDIDTSEQGELLATVTFSNLMAQLDATKPYYTSKNFVDQIRPGDTSYDQVYEGSGAISLAWGKIPYAEQMAKARS
jgi:hypothetical protein